mmetsp:Transcript_10934/g.26819  ORF Transcript_10934/g.26819 Transcript_10934/m.26819 type:complete len:274 (+) Transcript_10934:244-1065(+)
MQKGRSLDDGGGSGTGSDVVGGVKKRVLLVRHAESEENVQVRAAQDVFSSLSGFRLPKASDFGKMMKLLRLQHDADLSENGRAMVVDARKDLEDKKWLSGPLKPDLVLHSPLKRAVQTYEGMIQPLIQKETPVICSDLLVEKQVSEYAYAQSAFRKRIQRFEQYLDTRPEETILIVGHSQFFRSMLGEASSVRKFKNCDLWEFQRNGEGKRREWIEIKNIFTSALASSQGCWREDSGDGHNNTLLIETTGEAKSSLPSAKSDSGGPKPHNPAT